MIHKIITETFKRNITNEMNWKHSPEAEFKEFEPWFNFETQLKYGWFHLKLCSMFQDLSLRLIKTGFWGI